MSFQIRAVGEILTLPTFKDAWRQAAVINAGKLSFEVESETRLILYSDGTWAIHTSNKEISPDNVRQISWLKEVTEVM